MNADSYHRLIAGTDSGLYISEDHGATWNNITTGYGIERVNGMIETRDNRIIVGTGSGAMELGTNGSDWVSITNGLPAGEILSLAANNDGHLFAGTSHGLYHSVDGGNSWHLSGGPFTDLPVYTVITNPATGTIFAGTGGEGAFWAQQYTSSVSVAELPSTRLNVRITPNPIRANALLHLALTERGSVVVEIFNAVGERVVLVEEGLYEAGKQTIPLDLSMLPNGQYFCRVKGGKEVTIEKLVVD
jgi:hypothetical protein